MRKLCKLDGGGSDGRSNRVSQAQQQAMPRAGNRSIQSGGGQDLRSQAHLVRRFGLVLESFH
jgi:hypothetical protein